jgi:hypothetical protein
MMNHKLHTMIADGALFVANHCGGKDSQAMLIKLLEVVPANQLLVVHATLGELEWPVALELAKRQGAKAGVSFVIARAARGSRAAVVRYNNPRRLSHERGPPCELARRLSSLFALSKFWQNLIPNTALGGKRVAEPAAF